MSNFKNNFSELLLLSQRNIKFWNDENSFELIPMSLENTLFNEDLAYVINFLDIDITELKKQINYDSIDSHYSYVHLILSLSKKREEVKELAQSLLNGFKTIIPDLTFESGILKIKNFFLDKDLFNEITIVIFKILEKKKIIINDGDDPFTKKEKEIKLRAERIRREGRRNKENEKGTDFKDSFAAIIYEFPQYKIEDLFKLNIYTFHYLFKYIGRIANYEVSKIAAGNGLIKSGKHKYFIEK